jgi:hypothetical protein
MDTWTGWTAASETAAKTASTWDEWCACQRRLLGSEKRQQARQHEGMPFSDRELARLSFVRWLYQTGRLDPAQNDND